MNTALHTGVTGAKRQSWQQGNPRELLRRLMEDHKNWDRTRLLREFREQLDKSPNSYLETIVEYWFANNYNSLIDPREPDRIRDKVAVTKIRTKIEEHVETKAQLILLDLMMPNGKLLRDCTGQECRSLARSVGAWLARIAKRVKLRETVGTTLTENEVRELMK